MTIALVDWNTSGHHRMHMRQFAQTLLATGHRVIVLYPAPGEIRNAVIHAGGKLAVAPFRRVKYPLWPAPLRHWAEALPVVSNFKRQLAACERRLGAPCDFVFFNCLYEKQTWLVRALAGACAPRPWSFLYLHANAFPPHSGKNKALLRLLRHDRLKAIAVLDERTAAPGENLTGRRVVVFPDFTNTDHDPRHPLERELRAFKGDAPLVLAIGHLLRNKNHPTLLQAALRPEARDIKFAFIGQVSLSRKTRRTIATLKKNAPNLCFKFDYLESDLAYNACIRASDVLFAAYRDFMHSSNTLAKAAAFERPVIVSEGHLMAQRTREFNLGEIIPQDDVTALLRAIRTLTTQQPGEPRRWSDYRARHSLAALREAFACVLEPENSHSTAVFSGNAEPSC